ncbi:MAG TPA: hypothetical protein VFG50_09410 [Rhodothermales bacterium]|nr:hypothetical protein [Rhodothermales bacterium]
MMSPSEHLSDSYVLDLRYRRTLAFLQASVAPPARILDLGTRNRFSEIMEAGGFEVHNTEPGVDLDINPEVVQAIDADVVTAFEIFEHLVAPFNVLRAITAPRLIASVPLRLWFSTAYRNPNDPWDCHFHEFEDWQFDWLLDKAGWSVVRREKWNSPGRQIGFRPFLRRVTPRYYIIDARRKAGGAEVS